MFRFLPIETLVVDMPATPFLSAGPVNPVREKIAICLTFHDDLSGVCAQHQAR
jgi:hypothetical protein